MSKRLIFIFILVFSLSACEPPKKVELNSLCTKENESHSIAVDGYLGFPAIGCANSPVFRSCEFELKNDPRDKQATVTLSADVGEKNNQAREPDHGDKTTVQLVADNGSKISPEDKVTVYGRIFIMNEERNVCRIRDVSKIEKKAGQ